MGRYKYNSRYKKRRARKKWLLMPIIVMATFIAASITTNSKPQTPFAKNNETNTATAFAETQPEVSQELSWPTYGQAALVTADKVIVPEVQDKSVPIASLAKIITALAIIEKSPLKPGDQGPSLTFTDDDILLYNEYLAKDGSVVPIEVGEQLSQYQILQAMLLPSANNISDSAAIWLFGSVEDYTVYANDMLRRYGFTDTHVADASGFSPLTVSTAQEIAKLGTLLIEQPVLLEIVKQPSVNLPLAGEIPNYNVSLNGADFIGLKVGFTDEAGKTYVAAKIDEHSQEVKVAAILGADNFVTLKNDMQALLDSKATAPS